MHAAMFQDEATLRQIVQAIVVPNLQLRESDEELFEDNPEEYVQRDMEGSDSDTRRQCACDLVRALCKNFDAQTTAICSGHLEQMLGEYSRDMATNWRAKDAAVSVRRRAARAPTRQGATWGVGGGGERERRTARAADVRVNRAS